MSTILLYLIAGFTFCAAVRKAWRDATAADQAESDYQRFRQRANRHRPPSGPGSATRG